MKNNEALAAPQITLSDFTRNEFLTNTLSDVWYTVAKETGILTPHGKCNTMFVKGTIAQFRAAIALITAERETAKGVHKRMCTVALKGLVASVYNSVDDAPLRRIRIRLKGIRRERFND